jgi:hypothetical protein
LTSQFESEKEEILHFLDLNTRIKFTISQRENRRSYSAEYIKVEYQNLNNFDLWPYAEADVFLRNFRQKLISDSYGIVELKKLTQLSIGTVEIRDMLYCDYVFPEIQTLNQLRLIFPFLEDPNLPTFSGNPKLRNTIIDVAEKFLGIAKKRKIIEEMYAGLEQFEQYVIEKNGFLGAYILTETINLLSQDSEFYLHRLKNYCNRKVCTPRDALVYVLECISKESIYF